jgi:hypothetical protein
MTVPAADKIRVDYVCDEHSHHELEEFQARNTAADLLDAIDALHQPSTKPFEELCGQCAYAFPCPTARLLHPGGEP